MTETTTTIPLRHSGKHTMEEAQLLLTLGEANAIQRHYGHEMGQGLYGIELTAGVIWALERRSNLAASEKFVTWDQVEAIPLGDLNDYFIPEQIDVDETTPETESGKDSAPSE